MTKNEMKSFKPTPDMIRAAENCFAAMAFTELIRPIVEAYQRKVLAELRAPMAKKWTDDSRIKGHTILEPDHTYLMEDADFQTYLTRTREEQAKAGLHTDSPEFCPLLVAEHIQVLAEWALIEAMEPVTHITEVYGKNRDKLLDLTLRFLSPFCDTESTLKRLKAA
jgi:hypothetical protein